MRQILDMLRLTSFVFWLRYVSEKMGIARVNLSNGFLGRDGIQKSRGRTSFSHRANIWAQKWRSQQTCWIPCKAQLDIEGSKRKMFDDLTVDPASLYWFKDSRRWLSPNIRRVWLLSYASTVEKGLYAFSRQSNWRWERVRSDGLLLRALLSLIQFL